MLGPSERNAIGRDRDSCRMRTRSYDFVERIGEPIFSYDDSAL